MSLTVADLVRECELTLAAGEDGADRALRWVHISEHEDPTPWLAGGEVLLTTGYQLRSQAKQRRFVERLHGAEVAGLGFGTGFDHKRLPKAIVDTADEVGLPLFEVPYEKPFIAITERAAAHLVNEQFDALERGTHVHEQLERLVIEGRGLEQILSSTAAAIGGSALVLDAGGRELAAGAGARGIDEESSRVLAAELAAQPSNGALAPIVPSDPALAARALAVPVPGGHSGAAVAWLVVVADRDRLGDFERLCARQAAMVVGLELMRDRVVRETERRLSGDLVADALGGRLDAEEMRGRLRPFGIAEEAAILVFELEDPPGSEALLETALADAGVSAVVATSTAAGRPLLCAVVDASSDPVGTARRAREALAGGPGRNGIRAAASRPTQIASLRRAFHEARCALEATSLMLETNGTVPDVASHRDLGAFTLLLALQDDDALRLYSDGLLDPIERTEGEYGGELLRSLEAFIENNGNWERAARQLYCHRHTLRYRMRKIEELTGRDLSRATDRIELWLALRARELVR